MSDAPSALAAEGPYSGRSLAEAFAGRLEIGCAVGGSLPGSLAARERALLLEHFSVLTPENCMKPEPIQPRPGTFDFAAADGLVAFAGEHGLSVVGHCLSWHQQSPGFLYDDAPDRETALGRLAAHVTAVAGRYCGRIAGRIVGWDVVNEAIENDGSGLRDTPARRAIGDDYVERVFELAQRADPGAELYYNDYDIELPAKRDATLTLLERLQASGQRLDGVGIQGHWMLDRVPFDELRAAIVAYNALGLKVMITELDLDVVERPRCGADVSLHHAYQPADDVFAAGCPDAVLERQAEQYARLFEIFTDPALDVRRVTFWGLQDGHSWLNTWPGKRTNHPLLFDRDCRAKPALDAVLTVARRRRREAAREGAEQP